MDDIFDDDYDEAETIGRKRKAPSSKTRQARPKVVSYWTDAEIFKLINCVEYMQLLWNVRDRKYRNKVERQLAWKNMSEHDFESKFSDIELKAKWLNVRIEYRSYLTKFLKTKSGHGAKDAVKWKFFRVMEFVGQEQEHTSTVTVSNLDTDETTNDANEHASTPVPPKRIRLSQSSSTTANSTSVATIVAEGMKSGVSQLKGQRKNEDDEFDSFGKYIAHELRLLNDRLSVCRVRFKVMRCLMDAIEAENLEN